VVVVLAPGSEVDGGVEVAVSDISTVAGEHPVGEC
jgi:hypothetical protein